MKAACSGRMRGKMSNILNRGKKKAKVIGLSKKEMDRLTDRMGKSSIDILIEDAFQNLRLISYQVLHDKCGFGNKRITRVEQIIHGYLDMAADGNLSAKELEYYLKKTCEIDAKEEANKVPFRERLALTEKKVVPAAMQTAGRALLASICNYFVLLGICLKTQFKFSARRIKETFEWMRYYINSLATGYETMAGVASVLECECGYFDVRFLGKTYEV